MNRIGGQLMAANPSRHPPQLACAAIGPARLVVPQGPERRQRGSAYPLGEASQYLSRRGTREEGEVEPARDGLDPHALRVARCHVEARRREGIQQDPRGQALLAVAAAPAQLQKKGHREIEGIDARTKMDVAVSHLEPLPALVEVAPLLSQAEVASVGLGSQIDPGRVVGAEREP
jgi:hypothetical protein